MPVNVNYAAIGVMLTTPCGSWRILCDGCRTLRRPMLNAACIQWERSA